MCHRIQFVTARAHRTNVDFIGQCLWAWGVRRIERDQIVNACASSKRVRCDNFQIEKHLYSPHGTLLKSIYNIVVVDTVCCSKTRHFMALRLIGSAPNDEIQFCQIQQRFYSAAVAFNFVDGNAIAPYSINEECLKKINRRSSAKPAEYIDKPNKISLHHFLSHETVQRSQSTRFPFNVRESCRTSIASWQVTRPYVLHPKQSNKHANKRQ